MYSSRDRLGSVLCFENHGTKLVLEVQIHQDPAFGITVIRLNLDGPFANYVLRVVYLFGFRLPSSL